MNDVTSLSLSLSLSNFYTEEGIFVVAKNSD